MRERQAHNEKQMRIEMCLEMASAMCKEFFFEMFYTISSVLFPFPRDLSYCEIGFFLVRTESCVRAWHWVSRRQEGSDRT